MIGATQVLSPHAAASHVCVPALYDAQVARLRSIAEQEYDHEGIQVWCLSESQLPDAVGLPGRRFAQIWMTTESRAEAFEAVGKRMVDEWQLYGFDLSITWDVLLLRWVCTLSCKEGIR